MRQFIPLVLVLSSFAAGEAFGQGLETAAAAEDWEEINFAFDRDVLTDGYPSLLRLAELLNANPDYSVRLVGHADHLGSEPYNRKLSESRANTVREFLIKYGARAGQITVEARGEGEPRSPQRNREGRWMNRRVAITVRDGDGNIVSAGGVGDAISALEDLAKKQEDCCNRILDKLDEIMAMLKDLKDENQNLKDEIAGLKKDQDDIKDDVQKYATTPPAPPAPSAGEVAKAVTDALPKPSKKYSTLRFNVGPDTPDGNVSFSGKGRLFVPFATRHAFQTEGEFLHFFGRNEGQYDAGLVSRFGRVQVGGFSSFKYVKFEDFQSAAALGQGSFTLDYIFNGGRVGFFGTKRFMDGSVVNSVNLGPNVIEETYLRVVDQVGFSTTFGVWGDAYVEGNIGAMFRQGGDNKPGGTWRLVQPVAKNLAVTVEGGFNETLLSNDTTGRVVVGMQFGPWMSPKEYDIEGDAPVPADIPRVRYEILKRQKRTGNDLPIADAGADLIGIEPGPVTLDGSNSFDPDGDPITFQWQQIGGDPVALTGAETQQASFTAVEGERYAFRLTVRDDQGGVGTDRVTVTAEGDGPVKIIRFSVDPQMVQPGDPATLVWEVQNAESVEITGLGNVDPNAGTQQVFPSETTTYTLTARSATEEINQSVTVNVVTPAVQIVSFTASPNQIAEGESATLAWETLNADTVTIDGIGAVGRTGTTSVSPVETTTYRLTASNVEGSVTRTVTVEVTPDAEPVAPPRILDFSAAPPEIAQGDEATLSWSVEGADRVTISGIGAVGDSGSQTVSPASTMSYTLTASNAAGEVAASVTVTVSPDGGNGGDGQVRIVSFEGNPQKVKEPGQPVTLSWDTENANQVELIGLGLQSEDGSVVVRPYEETTYTLVAFGAGGNQVTATVTILVEIQNRSPMAITDNDRIVSGPAEGSSVVLDATRSFDPDGDPITFQWRNIGDRPVQIVGATTATPTVRFMGGLGEYLLEVEVRDDKGLRDFAQVMIRLTDLGTPPDLVAP